MRRARENNQLFGGGEISRVEMIDEFRKRAGIEIAPLVEEQKAAEQCARENEDGCVRDAFT